MSNPSTEGRNQGEGNREAAREFNAEEQRFVQSEGGQRKIREGTHLQPEEEREAREAEQQAKERAKAQDSNRM